MRYHKRGYPLPFLKGRHNLLDSAFTGATEGGRIIFPANHQHRFLILFECCSWERLTLKGTRAYFLGSRFVPVFGRRRSRQVRASVCSRREKVTDGHSRRDVRIEQRNADRLLKAETARVHVAAVTGPPSRRFRSGVRIGWLGRQSNVCETERCIFFYESSSRCFEFLKPLFEQGNLWPRNQWNARNI